MFRLTQNVNLRCITPALMISAARALIVHSTCICEFLWLNLISIWSWRSPTLGFQDRWAHAGLGYTLVIRSPWHVSAVGRRFVPIGSGSRWQHSEIALNTKWWTLSCWTVCCCRRCKMNFLRRKICVCNRWLLTGKELELLAVTTDLWPRVHVHVSARCDPQSSDELGNLSDLIGAPKCNRDLWDGSLLVI